MLPTSLPPALRRQFSLSDIKSATNNFSGDLIIGKGSFGNVYKATIDTGSGNTTTVAVKRRSSDSKQGSKEFWTEVNLLSELRHTHLISLIGYCVDLDANEMILVYEYMANGTLADHIYKNNENSSRLNWEQRLKICIGVGRGVEYLHTGTGIDKVVIHRDLKSSNILLDADYAAKLSDFGLCKICSGDRSYNPIIASVKGTLGYMDPNYRNTRQLSTKTDVYAIGVVLLEVLCGRRSLDFDVVDREKRLVLWAQQCIREGVVHRIIDPGLRGRIADDGLSIFVDITLKCLQDRPDRRPTMVEIVAKLEAVLASQYTAYSSSVDDEFVKIFFGNVSCSSSSARSDADTSRGTVCNSSAKSETIKQDLGSESNVGMKSKSSSSLPVDLQNNGLKAVYETSHDEYEKLARGMNPPKVAIDNESCENATIIEANSSSTQVGLLLDLLQLLTEFDLIITKASRTSNGSSFMYVFYVTDQEGYKITDNAKIQNIQEILPVYLSSALPTGGNQEEKSTPPNHKTIKFIEYDLPVDMQNNNRLKAAYETSHDEYEKLFRRMNPTKVAIDNNSCKNATIIEVESAKKHGILLEVVQVLSDLNLIITKAYISSDGGWFMDVFNVTDQEGKKITDEEILNYIQKVLSETSFGNSVQSLGVTSSQYCTTIELIGSDRPGLLSEVCTVLLDLNCNVLNAEMWTHNTWAAFIVQVTYDESGSPIMDPKLLLKIKQRLCSVLEDSNKTREAKIAAWNGAIDAIHTGRRLNQTMLEYRDYERENGAQRPDVNIVNWYDKNCSVVTVRCKDSPKLLFDTVCTLTDMEYVVIHGNVYADGMKAYQEYCIRHIDGSPVKSEAERQRMIQCIEAAIVRRVFEGLKLELCTTDRIGLLYNVTRTFRENSLRVTRAEVATRGGKAIDTFYVCDASGCPVNSKNIDFIREKIGKTVLKVKGNPQSSNQESSARFLFGGLFKS